LLADKIRDKRAVDGLKDRRLISSRIAAQIANGRELGRRKRLRIQ